MPYAAPLINYKLNRRQALGRIATFGAAIFGTARMSRAALAAESMRSSQMASPLADLFVATTSSPGKHARITNLSDAEHVKLLSLLATPGRSAVGQFGHSIYRTGTWGIGRLPNYTTTIPQAAPTGPAIGAACYGSGAVYHVDTAGEVRSFDCGNETNPLDVVYDPFRHRLVVASANADAHMIVIDLGLPGRIVRRIPLARLTGQGVSQGGIQGVTVDIAGDYWLALSYFGIQDGGVLIKVDGRTLQPIRIIKNAGMNNPNGLTTGYGGQILFAMSDNGTVQEFDLGGSLLRVHQSVNYGYRGTVSGDMLWVCGWLLEGRMARINLLSGERREFDCVPLANSVAVDHNGYVWVAGDAGLSVSTAAGDLLAQTTFGAFTNGLSVLDNAVYFVSYDEHLNEARTIQPLLHFPTVRGAAAVQ